MKSLAFFAIGVVSVGAAIAIIAVLQDIFNGLVTPHNKPSFPDTLATITTGITVMAILAVFVHYLTAIGRTLAPSFGVTP